MAFDLNTPLGQELVRQGQAQGYAPEQIAGVLGGAMTESGFDPNASGDNGTAYGGFQWRKDRQDALRQRASAMGLDPSDPRVQAAHIYGELGSSEAGAGMGDAKSPQDAAGAIVSALRPAGYTPGNPQNAARYDTYLNNTLMAYRALNGGGGGMSEGRSVSPATSDDTTNINNMLARANGTSATTGNVPQGGLLSYLTNPDNPGSASLGDRFTKLGAALMMRDNPTAAATMLNSIKAQQKSADSQWKDIGDTGDGKFRKQINTATGQYRDVPQEHPDTPEADTPDVPKSADIKALSDNTKVIYGASQNIDSANKLQDAILDGKFNARWDSRIGAYVDNLSGKSTENSRLIKDANALINQYVINVASQEKGPMTKAKMENARLSVLPSGAENDNATLYSAFQRIKDVQAANHGAASTAALSIIDAHPKLDANTVGPDGKPGSLKDFIANKGTAWDATSAKQQARLPDFLQQHDNPPKATSGPVPVKNADDYAKLPPGATYIDPDGKVRRKAQ